jgi:hypothetical protein
MTRHFDFRRPHVDLPALRSRVRDAVVSRGSIELGAAGAVALGAVALGAIAIGAVAINRMRIRRARIERLSVGTLHVERLVIDHRDDPEDEVFDDLEAESDPAEAA